MSKHSKIEFNTSQINNSNVRASRAHVRNSSIHNALDNNDRVFVNNKDLGHNVLKEPDFGNKATFDCNVVLPVIRDLHSEDTVLNKINSIPTGSAIARKEKLNRGSAHATGGCDTRVNFEFTSPGNTFNGDKNSTQTLPPECVGVSTGAASRLG